jgi:hypothetical protein
VVSSDRFTPGKKAPGARWIRDWVCLRAGLDDVEKRKIFCLYRDSDSDASTV